MKYSMCILFGVTCVVGPGVFWANVEKNKIDKANKMEE